MTTGTSPEHLTESDLMEITQSVWDERKNKRSPFLNGPFHARDTSRGARPEFMEHILDCPQCLYLLWESIGSLYSLSETKLISKPSRLALKLNTMKNSFQAFIKQGTMLPLSLVPAPVLRSEAPSEKGSLIEAAYSLRAEGIKNLFILNIRSRGNSIQFNIRGQMPFKNVLNISFYKKKEKIESQSIGRNNPKVTFSMHYEDVQKKQNIRFLISSSSIQETELLELLL